MKRHYAILIIFILALKPVLAFATEPDESFEIQPTQVPENESSPQPQTSNTPQESIPDIEDTLPPPEPTVDDDNGGNPVPNVEEVNKEATDDTNSNNDSESTDENDESDIDEEDNAENTEGESENDIPKEHTHSFTYISNDDGTHTVKCTEIVESITDDGENSSTECTYEDIEECEYNEDGICIYCDYVKPDEEVTFEPSINVSISNQSCIIGKINPVICLDISQDDFDVEYAQICFANYNKSKFINVGLMHGKYLNRKTGEYVYPNDDCWYSSPNISDYYEEGTYYIRSIYARCTNGDFIHYSLESDTLSEELQEISISILEATDDDYKESESETDTDSFTFTRDSSVEEHINHNPSIENPPETAAPQEDSIIENPSPEERTNGNTEEETLNTEETTENNTVEPVSEEPVIEEPVVNKPTVEESSVDKPSEDKPSVEEPVTEEPATEKPVTDKPAADKPAVEEPAIENPPLDGQTADKPNEIQQKEESDTKSSKETKESEPASLPKKIINSILNFIKRIFRFW